MVILACESCGENRRHDEPLRGSVATLEEHRELVCNVCGHVSHTEQTLAPVVQVRFDVTIRLKAEE